jgi:transcriptional regulator with XRE-family HTH domain
MAFHVHANFRPREYDTLSGAIRHFREQANMTQPQLAKKAGCSQSTISAYESGRVTPSIKKLQLLSQALNVPIARFIDHRISIVD